MNLNDILVIGSHTEISIFNESSYLIINNISGKYIKINRNFYLLLQLFDGKKSIREIRLMYNSIYGNITQEFCLKIIEKLDEIGTFKTSNNVNQRKKLPAYLSFGFIFFPAKLVGKIVPHLKFLFNKNFAVVFLSLSFFSFCFLLYKNFRYSGEINFLEILPIFIPISLACTIFHEFGHATATHFYNAKHGGIGFGLCLYFMPVFFADVADIWRLKKWERIIVNVSGVYFAFIFCSILILISMFLESKELFAIVSALVFKQVYNLIPYLRTDGYWIASDYFNQPNLMINSFQKFKNLISFKVKDFSKKDYFLAIYGVFNFGLMTYFIGFMLMFHFSEIIIFPKEMLSFTLNVNIKSFSWNFNEISRKMPVVIFYFFAGRILINLIKKAVYYKKMKFSRNV
jgi:putative peptide zinc metalloprotease protein